MKPERWQQVEKIFNEALELEPQQRSSFLDKACGDDSWLRQKIEALIRADDGAASFLESPASESVRRASVPQRGQFLGRVLGAYQIESHLGSGGMGDVYRARDTKLKRNVAIKILPPEFSRDPDRVARFQREAVALAALNHPNIAAIHDLQEIDGNLFLLLEFVEGETLAALLKRAPLAIERAIEICKQVAEGIEAAHAKGINHRDLKPQNIQITPADRVKLLDFGLAKMFVPDGEDKSPADLPNITQWNTKPGLILGTAAYLSPEQARGHRPDKRSDIWAFGCVLFEALTGKLAFSGDTVTDVLAAILKSEPDWNLLPRRVPASVRFLLGRCLQKDVKNRLHEIADARMVLEDALAAVPSNMTAPGSAKKPPAWVLVAVAAILAAVIAVVVTWNIRSMETINDTKTAVQAPPGATVPSPTLSAEQEARPLAFSWILPQGQMLTRTLQRGIAISRDGANVAYTSNDRLYLRPISGAQAQIISGTSGALLPTFSPDGRWLAFWAFQDRTLKKISIDGGAVVTLAPAPTLPSSASWEGDSIAFAAPNLGILAVSSSGGTPDVWVPIEPGEIADSPQILDGGNSVLFSVTRDTGQRRWDKADIVLFSRQTGTRKVLIRGGSDARYIPTGHIIYALETTLFSVPFNPARQEVTGNPVPVLENVYHGYREISFWPFGIAQFALAANGTLIYIPSNLLSNTLSRSSEIRVVVNWLNEFKQRVK